MPFVHRENGKIVAVCFSRQTQAGFDNEALPEGHAEIVAFRKRGVDSAAGQRQRHAERLEQQLSDAIDRLPADQQTPFRLLLELNQGTK